MAAADLEQVVGGADLQDVDRPYEPLRCSARHVRSGLEADGLSKVLAVGIELDAHDLSVAEGPERA